MLKAIPAFFMATVLAGCIPKALDPWEIAAARLPEEIRLAKRAGISLSPPPWPVVARELNAAPDYELAGKQLKALENAVLARYRAAGKAGEYRGAFNLLMYASEKKQGTNLAEAARLRKAVKPILQRVLEAARKPYCVPKTPNEPSSHLSNIVKHLVVEAEFLSIENNPKAAGTMLTAAARVSFHRMQTDNRLGPIMTDALNLIIFSSLERLTSRHASSPEALRLMERVLGSIRSVGPAEALASATEGLAESYAGADSGKDLKKMFAEQSFMFGELPPLDGVADRTLAKALHACELEAYREAYANAREPMSRLQRLRVTAVRWQDSPDPVHRVAGKFVALNDAIPSSLLESRGRVLALKIKIAALRFKLKTGSYPANLRDIGFDRAEAWPGNPIDYRPAAKGFRIEFRAYEVVYLNPGMQKAPISISHPKKQ